MNIEPGESFIRMAGLPAGAQAHARQGQLLADSAFSNRLIRIPTGMGKTYGVLGAWLWNRLERQDHVWPRRLVWCLPMRVLVEQVAAEIATALQRLGGSAAAVPVHTLMGGADTAPWQIEPEREAVLVGTQDMLISRALNRGYAASRARWPVEFGLLNHDCLWVMDEVQLMDVGLATSAQLQAFRDDDAGKALRPCKTWWMSATLQPGWLARSRRSCRLPSRPAPVGWRSLLPSTQTRSKPRPATPRRRPTTSKAKAARPDNHAHPAAALPRAALSRHALGPPRQRRLDRMAAFALARAARPAERGLHGLRLAGLVE